MSSDYQYIEDHMGGHDEDGLPNFMSEPGFSDNSYDDNEEYTEEDEDIDDLEIEVGDIVKLNSSDVSMTIKSINDNTLVCRWFDKNNTLQTDEFDVLEITIVKMIQDKELQQSYQAPKKQQPTIFDIDEDEIPF